MSGDRIMKTPLQTSRISTEGIKEFKSSRKTEGPTIITVSANGHEIQSCLNPNALEFIPCYLRKTPQVDLNAKRYDEKVQTKNEQIDSNKKLEQNFCDIRERLGIQDISDDVHNFLKKENENVTTKLEMNIEENQVHVLFASSSSVVNTSSETVRSVLSASEMVNSFLEIQEEKHYDINEEIFIRDLESTHLPDVGKNVTIQDISRDIKTDRKADTNETLKFNKGNIPLNILFTTSSAVVNSTSAIVKSFLPDSESENIKADNQKEDAEICNDHKRFDIFENSYTEEGKLQNRIAENYLSNEQGLSEEYNSNVKEPENLVLESFNDINRTNNETKYRTDKEENYQNINNFNEIDMETKSTEHKQIVSIEVNDAKKILNVDSKIATVSRPPAGRNTKISLAKTPEKEIKPKTEPMVVQNSTVSKFSKCPSLIPSKPCSKPFKKELSKPITKDTGSNKSSTSTEKSLTSNKFCANNSNAKSAENPIRFGPKPKECIAKSPRATVSSKLRKAETQERRNLFFELDSIKMSEFLFK